MFYAGFTTFRIIIFKAVLTLNKNMFDKLSFKILCLNVIYTIKVFTFGQSPYQKSIMSQKLIVNFVRKNRDRYTLPTPTYITVAHA